MNSLTPAQIKWYNLEKVVQFHPLNASADPAFFSDSRPLYVSCRDFEFMQTACNVLRTSHSQHDVYNKVAIPPVPYNPKINSPKNIAQNN